MTAIDSRPGGKDARAVPKKETIPRPRLLLTLRAFLCILIGILPACLRILPPLNLEDPAASVERHVLCASVVVGRDGAEPGPDKTVFARAAGGAVYAFVEFKNLRGKHALVWKWYDPERALFRMSDPIVAGVDGRTFASYFAWDRLTLPQGRDPGMWTSSLFIDGILAASRTFEIRPLVP